MGVGAQALWTLFALLAAGVGACAMSGFAIRLFQRDRSKLPARDVWGLQLFAAFAWGILLKAYLVDFKEYPLDENRMWAFMGFAFVAQRIVYALWRKHNERVS